MPETRRHFIAGKPYEICFRAREGLPIATIKLMKLLLKGILARVQRDMKITICHHLWMGNHPHFLVVMRDAEQCKRFYQEVEKKITDSMKRLLGVSHLSLWAQSPRVIRQCTFEDVKNKIVYLYMNPSAADLVDSIDEYPGLSSWEDFVALKDKSVAAKTSVTCPWVQLPMIEKLPSLALSRKQDKFLADKLRNAAKRSHALIIEPNAWMACFGITEQSEISSINESIVQRIRETEKEYRERRALAGKRAMGAHRLSLQPIMKPHTPKKNGRRIHIESQDKEVRLKAIQEHRAFCEECRRCYQCWKNGDFTVIWPPGAFLPPAPPRANAVPLY